LLEKACFFVWVLVSFGTGGSEGCEWSACVGQCQPNPADGVGLCRCVLPSVDDLESDLHPGASSAGLVWFLWANYRAFAFSRAGWWVVEARETMKRREYVLSCSQLSVFLGCCLGFRAHWWFYFIACVWAWRVFSQVAVFTLCFSVLVYPPSYRGALVRPWDLAACEFGL